VRVRITLVPVEITLRVEITLKRVVSIIFQRIRFKITIVCVENQSCVLRTPHVETNPVRVKITLLRVRILFMLVKITLRVEITLCV
jgi:hypothetical protein